MKPPTQNERLVGCVWCGETVKGEDWTRDDEGLLEHLSCAVEETLFMEME